MKKLITLFLLIPLISMGIEPLIVKLDDSNPTYTVPSGKVVVIEHLFSTDIAEPLEIILDVVTGDITNTLVFYAGDRYSVTLSGSLKIPSSAVLQRGIIDEGYGPETNSVIILTGLLAEPSDLYAYIDSEAGSMLVQGGMFSFDVHAATPRPARLTVEGTADLLSAWQPADATVGKDSPDTYTVSIPVEDEEKYFAKYTLRGIDP